MSLKKFGILIEEITRLHNKRTQDVKNLNICFSKFIFEIKKSKSFVYPTRLIETQNKICESPEAFEISSFELMEHNFRENTHSNILEYIFNYENTGDEATIALLALLSLTENTNSLNIKFNQRNYNVEREVRVESGRIDLCISDKKNKFLIIIENKIYADISESFDIATETNHSQLDKYCKYYLQEKKYKDWDKIFILLSYKELPYFSHSNFKLITYGMFYEKLKAIQFKDKIAKDYKTLLYSLTKNILNKKLFISNSNKIIKGYEEINLNELETINNYIDGF